METVILNIMAVVFLILIACLFLFAICREAYNAFKRKYGSLRNVLYGGATESIGIVIAGSFKYEVISIEPSNGAKRVGFEVSYSDSDTSIKISRPLNTKESLEEAMLLQEVAMLLQKAANAPRLSSKWLLDK